MPQSAPPVPRLVWAVLAISNLIYAVVLLTQFGGLSAPFPSGHPLLVPLMVISSMALAISMVLPKAFFIRAKQRLDQAGTSVPTEAELQAAFFAPWVIRMAMLESISVYGFVLAMVTQAPVAFLPFGAVALLTQLSQYPSPQRIRGMLGVK
jgi:hypothetical protein